MSKKWSYAFVLSILISIPCYAQEWAKTFGGSNQDFAGSIIKTLDGGYAVAGQTYSFGAGRADFWILKLASGGAVEWEKTYGGSDSDSASSIKQTPDGGYIVAGTTTGAVQDIWVLRLNSSGDIIWEKTYDLGVSELAVDIQLTSDGGYILSGFSAIEAGISDIWVLKLNPDGHPSGNGSIAWEKTYGGNNWDEVSSVQEIYNQSGEPDGYIVAGRTYSFGAGLSDVWILKLNTNGAIVWDKTYGGSEEDWPNSIRQTFDQSGDPDGFIMAGETHSFGLNSYDAWILRLDTDGTVIWQKAYGGNDQNDGALSIEQTSDGGYIFAGNTRSFGAGDWDLWVLKLYANGNIEWQKTYGGAFWETAPTILQTSEGGFVMSGFTKSYGVGPFHPSGGSTGDIWVLKLSALGGIPYCCAMTGESAAIVSNTSAVVGSSGIQPQTSSAVTGSLGVTSQVTTAETSTVCPGPYIEVAPMSHDFGDVMVGSQSSVTVTISNSGSADLHISGMVLSDTTNYSLNVSGGPSPCGSTTRTIAPANSCTVAVTFNPSSVGTKNASLSISSDAPCTPAANVLLTGIGVSFPIIGYSPASVSFTSTQGGPNPSNQVLSIWNAGLDTLNWTVNGDTPWLSLNPSSGTGNGTVTVGVDVSGLPAGPHDATITITAEGASNSPVSIPVSLTVNVSTPTIGVNPSVLSFTATEGVANPPDQNLIIFNAGDGTLIWTVTEVADWFALSPASGTDSGTVTAAVNIAGLTAGTYNSTISIAAPGATNSPVEIPVTLTINVPPLIRIGGPLPEYYPTLQDAYEAVSNGDIIQIQVGDVLEDLNFNREVTVSLKGGYNSDFTSNSSFSGVNGSIVIQNGTVVLEGIVIK